jgi:hypothetical protein
MRDRNYLFADEDLGDVLRQRTQSARDLVDRIPEDQFLNSPVDDVIEHVASQIRLTPIELYRDRARMEQSETQQGVSHHLGRNAFRRRGPIMVPAVRVVVSIPYTGDPILWRLRPSAFHMSHPEAEASAAGRNEAGQLRITLEQPHDEPQQRLKQSLDSTLEEIEFYLSNQASQLSSHNSGVRAAVEAAVSARRDRLKSQSGLTDLLGIPLAQKEGVPQLSPIDVKQKIVRPLPPPPKSGFKPEPGIVDEHYRQILEVIRHEGRTFETTPKTYAVHDEEELRDIILAHLNGQFRGAASGEVFRKAGKTDIRIEDDDRAAFVAECKVWRGTKELQGALDQLLSYLTWRDCKSALVVFNKHNAGFTQILEKAPLALQAHPRFKSLDDDSSDGEWGFTFMSEEDDARLIRVRLQVFNIYVPRA